MKETGCESKMCLPLGARALGAGLLGAPEAQLHAPPATSSLSSPMFAVHCVCGVCGLGGVSGNIPLAQANPRRHREKGGPCTRPTCVMHLPTSQDPGEPTVRSLLATIGVGPGAESVAPKGGGMGVSRRTSQMGADDWAQAALGSSTYLLSPSPCCSPSLLLCLGGSLP